MYICKYPVLSHEDPRTTEATELDVFVNFSHFLLTVKVKKRESGGRIKMLYLFIFTQLTFQFLLFSHFGEDSIAVLSQNKTLACSFL